jgi:hypothetical protein
MEGFILTPEEENLKKVEDGIRFVENLLGVFQYLLSDRNILGIAVVSASANVSLPHIKEFEKFRELLEILSGLSKESLDDDSIDFITEVLKTGKLV